MWQRKAEIAEGAVYAGTAAKAHPGLACDACGAPGASASGSEMWRCAYTKAVCFCSAECAAKGRDAHRSILATRLLFFDRHKPAAAFPGPAWQRLRNF